MSATVEPQPLAVPDDRRAGVAAADRSAALGDVVDAALDDERVGAPRAALEAGRDLVGALAEDAAVAELERGRRAAAQYSYWLRSSSPNPSAALPPGRGRSPVSRR